MAAQGLEPRGYLFALPCCAKIRMLQKRSAGRKGRWRRFCFKDLDFARMIWLGRFQNNARDVRETVHL
jgi:hypothetical protein